MSPVVCDGCQRRPVDGEDWKPARIAITVVVSGVGRTFYRVGWVCPECIAKVTEARPPQTKQLTALWLTEPARAAAQVSAALRQCKNLRAAARELCVSTSTLMRWVHARPELAEFRLTPRRE